MLLNYALLGGGAAILIILLIVAIRTIAFAPSKRVDRATQKVSVDKDRAAHTLAELVRCKTVSNMDRRLEDNSEFDRLDSILPELFPTVFEKCEYKKLSNRSILIKWAGKRSDSPTVLMSHYDVVGVDEDRWSQPPFDGVICDGVLWGRGTLDTKSTLNAIMCAAGSLISAGFVPEHDVYFAFGGDEEINGHGAPDIVDYFEKNNITPGFVLDEGGAVTENAFPGVKKLVAMIGIAEKGLLNVKYTVSGGGGHASSPDPITPIGRLSAACTRVERYAFPYRVTEPVKLLFDNAGRHSTLFYRMVFANLWIFNPILSLIGRKGGGEVNGMVRTTTAFTQMSGSKGANVIPAVAYMTSNHRILPGESVASTLARIKKTVNDPKVEISVINGHEPSIVSDTRCAEYSLITDTVSEMWHDAVVTPYLMLACSDSRHWGRICNKVYRFSPLELSSELRGTIHGNNERVSLDAIEKCVEFYIRLMKKL